MHSLNNKRVILGVSGGIAAYKSADLVRRLQDLGADVRVVMTRGAQEFITPLTMQALSGNPVHIDLLDTEAEAAMGHIELARWADLVLIAPATADLIARLSSGRADDLLTTLCLASDAPLAIAPAMNQAMWRDSGTQTNLKTLSERGIHIFAPAEGSQACGDIGPGRMQEAVDLAAAAAQLFENRLLDGLHAVITAGPTREAIDPVRFISNHSSGKMGFALAEAAVEAGATVTIIAGPVHLATPDRVNRVDVESAADMYAAVHQHLESCDIFISAAAVADFAPAQVENHKIKKGATDTMQINLVKTKDIVASVGALDQGPFTVGFAAETRDLEQYARDKLERKGLDMIIANDVSDTSIGFNSDENAVSVFDKNKKTSLPKTSKSHLARQLLALIARGRDEIA